MKEHSLNNEKLKKVVWNSLNHVPYYKQIYKTLDDYDYFNKNFSEIFMNLPCVSKQLYRKNYDMFISDDTDKKSLISEYTSGSVGEPFICYKSSSDKMNIFFSLYRHRKKHFSNLKMSDKCLKFYGSWTDINIENNMLLLSVFYLNKQNITRYVESIISFQPRWIFSTPSSIYNFLHLLNECELISAFREKTNIDYIETTGEILTENIKKYIEDSLSVKVHDHYGCREIWHLAFRCNYNNLHISNDNTLIEIVDKEGKNIGYNSEGEVAITGLNNFDVPFIRYRIGDVGSISSCKCGCGLDAPILNLAGGRVTESIKLPNGTEVSSVVIHHIFRKLGKVLVSGVEQYFVEQNDTNILIFNLVVNSNFNESQEQLIRSFAKTAISDEVDIIFRYKNTIDLSQTGKHKSFVSNI
jgi:phenylacetate-CoA ligase